MNSKISNEKLKKDRLIMAKNIYLYIFSWGTHHKPVQKICMITKNLIIEQKLTKKKKKLYLEILLILSLQ